MIDVNNQTLNSNNFVLVSPKKVCELLSISHTTLWRLSHNDARFPKGIRITAKKTVFRYAGLLAWAEGLNSDAQCNATTGRETMEV